MVSSAPMSDHAARLTADLEQVGDGLLLVVTGAGISLASGIPTFRGTDPGAIWKRDVTELGTYRYFREDPVGSWRWYLERFDHVLKAQPNAAHHALVELEHWHTARGGRFLLVTQNIDTLHDQAGTRQLVKVHGTADRVRCARAGCRFGSPSGSLPRSDFDLQPFLASPSLDLLPRCPECGDLLRQHVLWFDEFYNEHSDYQWERVRHEVERMRLCLFVGTSFSVGLTEMVLQAGILWKIPLISIDPSTTIQMRGLTSIPAQAEEILPEVCRRLGAGAPVAPL